MAAGRFITVLGSANADFVMRVDTLPQPGETVLGSHFVVHRGGKGANQAIACARLGGLTRFIGCVGDDAAGSDAIAGLNDDGVDTASVLRRNGQHTGTALIFVDDSGENCIGVASGANASLLPEDVTRLRAVLGDSAWLLMQLETPIDAIVQAALLADDAGVPVALNPAPAQGTLPPELWPMLTVVTPNRIELGVITGHPVGTIDSVIAASQILRERGTRTVITTLGQKGAVIVDENGARHVAGERLDAVDTVGAGDTFNGALIVALNEGKPVDDAVAFANAAAAIAVMRHGAQAAVPYRRELT